MIELDLAQHRFMAKPPLAVFRADAGPRIGGGHVMRCLTLARALAGHGWDCRFAVSPESGGTVPALARSGFPIQEVPSRSATDAAAICGGLDREAQLLVIDHPHYTAAEERALRSAARQRLVIDGRFRTHNAEIWLDPNPGHAIESLRPLANADCTILTGSAFVPVSAEVVASRDASVQRRHSAAFALNRVLVSFGAAEQGPAIELALQGLAAFEPAMPVTVLAGRAVGTAHGAARKLGLNARTLEWSDDIAALMADADLMVGAAGTNAWDRCCLGLPSLLLTVAPDQIATAAFLAEAGAAVNLGNAEETSPGALIDSLRDLAASPNRLRQMSQTAARLIDGTGAERIASEIDRLTESSQGRPVS